MPSRSSSRRLAVLLVLATAPAASAQAWSTSVDFSTLASFTDQFRLTNERRTGTAPVTVANGVLSYDGVSTSSSTDPVGETRLFDLTPADTSTATQSTLSLAGPITVAFDVAATAPGSFVSVTFADPYDNARNVSASFTLNTGADEFGFFLNRDPYGTRGARVGTAVTQSTTAEPGAGAALTRVTVTLSVSGTTPTLTLTADGAPAVTQTFPAGTFDWGRPLLSLRLDDKDKLSGTPLRLDNLVVSAGGAPAAPAAQTAPPPPVLPTAPLPAAGVNLLTVNPGFEAVAFSTSLENTPYFFSGWEGYKYQVVNGSHRTLSGTVAAGTTTEGTRAFQMDWGGRISTAVADRPVAIPGQTYEFRTDLKALVRNFERLVGTNLKLQFFDASDVLLKEYVNPGWIGQVQSSGKDVWGNFAVRGVAPDGAARLGVSIDARIGSFVSNTENYTRDRHVVVDDVRVVRIAEAADRVAVRSAPRLLEPGKIAKLRVYHSATAARTLSVRLVNSSAAVVASNSYPVPAGRRLNDIWVNLPASLPDGDYAWQVQLLPTAGGAALASTAVYDAFADAAVTLSSNANGTDFPASDPRLVYMGRINREIPAQPELNWFGSEVRLRFSGTSLALRGFKTNTNATAVGLVVVIDDDEAGATSVSVANTSLGTIPLVSGLPDGVHTARIFKSGESDQRLRIDAFRVDTGRGLLRPAPLPARKLEIFGDSVTSGSSAAPGYFGYAPRLGRELDADVHIVSKGGTGVAASFSNQDILINYWDNLTFPNVFNASATGSLPWDFSTWRPDAVLIAIGHNDQFNNGSLTFKARYAEFHGLLRSTYGAALPIISGNTIISAPLGFYEGALAPLLATDPNLRWVFQRSTEANVGGHPGKLGHESMVLGNALRFSYAEVLEEQLGWGLPPAETPPTALYAEDFNLLPVGSGAPGWTSDLVNGFSNTFGVVAVPSASDRSLALNDAYAYQAVSATLPFAPQSGPVEVSFRTALSVKSDWAKWAVCTAAGDLVSIRTLNGKLAYRTPAGTDVPLNSAYNAGQWYALRIVVDRAAGTAAIYLDNPATPTATVPLLAATGPVESFQVLGSISTVATIRLDDVRVTTP